MKKRVIHSKPEAQCVAQIKAIARQKTRSEMERTLNLSRRSIGRIVQGEALLCLRDSYLRDAIKKMFNALPRHSPSTGKAVALPEQAQHETTAPIQEPCALAPATDKPFLAVTVQDLDAFLLSVPYFDVFIMSSAQIKATCLQDIDVNVRGLARKMRMPFSAEGTTGALVFGLRQKLFSGKAPTMAPAFNALNTLSITVPDDLIRRCSVQEIISVLRMAAFDAMVVFLNTLKRESVLVRGAEQDALFEDVSGAWLAMRRENATLVERDYSLAVTGLKVPHDPWPGAFQHRVGSEIVKTLRALSTIT